MSLIPKIVSPCLRGSMHFLFWKTRGMWSRSLEKWAGEGELTCLHTLEQETQRYGQDLGSECKMPGPSLLALDVVVRRSDH